jgi:hypothetical protein
MSAYDLGRSPRPSVAPGPCLTSRPAAAPIIAMMFVLAVLVFLLGLLTLSV